MEFEARGGVLYARQGGKHMRIEAFGENSLRLRITRLSAFPDEDWALLEQAPCQPVIRLIRSGKPACSGDADEAIMRNGGICVHAGRDGKLRFENSFGKLLLQELHCGRLGIDTQELKALPGGNFRASLKFESDPYEKLFGMGQYQQAVFNLKGSVLELDQRNTQASVPFAVSSLGYGFLWNNPAIGRVSFATNMTEWIAENTKAIDFWITAGDTPAQILAQYMNVTGKPPMMPEHGLGFWQCKLRYQTQEELLGVAREYHRRGIPLDVIVADFFHWTLEGTWAFDPAYWPDPLSMVDELKAMGTRLMVSVWPTVSRYAPNHAIMNEKGYLVQTENGLPYQMAMFEGTSFADFTNPEARAFVWNQLRKNYYDMGIRDFWLDEAEPEYASYDFENYRYFRGPVTEVGNQYPFWYAKMVYDGLRAAGETDIVSLTRCAWAGSQRCGALIWTGDVPSTFESFRVQIICGLQMAMAGIPWWTTDIGGFSGGDVRDPVFQELLIRWFEYGAFCPVMRLHGDRSPHKPSLSSEGGGRCVSGADNEIWSFGEGNCRIMKKYIELREAMRPYTRKLMREAHETGTPVIRPLFYHFPEDERAWDVQDAFFFGEKYLVAPVTQYKMRTRTVYLPSGASWMEQATGNVFSGGQSVEANAPLDVIPVFIRQ